MSVVSPLPHTVADRLTRLRALMASKHIDAVLVRSTDAYLNEYVPTEESLRVFITGFTGSMGDALITKERAILVVDGRYDLQAKQEATDFEVIVTSLGTSIESAWMNLLPELAAQEVKVLGLETDRIPTSLYQRIHAQTQAAGIGITPTVPSLVQQVRDTLLGASELNKGPIWPVPQEIVGRTVKDRLTIATSVMQQHSLDAILVIPLDEIAWITNLRGEQFPFQATFRAQALVMPDRILLATEQKALKKAKLVEPEIKFIGENTIPGTVSVLQRERHGMRIGYDPTQTPEYIRHALSHAGAELVAIDSPFVPARAKKTDAELQHMAAAFAKADRVVDRVQKWLADELAAGNTVTESMVAEKTEQKFRQSGAFGLSFKVISAAGKNGAVIHYSNPDTTTPIEAGQMFLLDTGAYYDGGYATDLTRTFLAGDSKTKATDEQKRLFTLVLKAAIAGMSARLPKNATGEQLDAIVRDPLWRAGLNYAHGTGHGVGVNVHESPPRIAPGVRAPVEPGHVFSIEPGVYLAEFGGVRIENLCTCVVDPDDARFIRIKPLTFSPLDARLIDTNLLTPHEKNFLKWFKESAKLGDPLNTPLPPTC